MENSIKEVLPRGLCTMCMLGTTHFSKCPHCGVSNCRHIHREHVERCKEANPSLINHRPLHQIAAEIVKDWRPPYFAVVPYLDAMLHLSSIHDNFYRESARSVVLYFLSNAKTWKGETARRIKKELNNILKAR